MSRGEKLTYVVECVVLGLMVNVAVGGELSSDLASILAARNASESVSALVFLKGGVDVASLDAALERSQTPRAVRHETVVRALQDAARRTQPPFLARLAGLKAAGAVDAFQAFWIADVVRVDAPATTIRLLADDPAVEAIHPDYPLESAGETPTERGPGGLDNPEPGLIAMHVPEVWALGIDGTGVLVSSLDTGVDGHHPALASRWRGLDARYAGHPEWAWFDPVTHTTFPQDFASHGTHTMGTFCGGAPGDQIGVAPGAQWIHAATIDRVSIQRTVSDSILAFQWLIDPDGNPSTAWDVPAISSNSWSLTTAHGYPACDQTFWSFLDAVEAAGTAIVFSAGSDGPAPNTIRRPADRAVDDYRTLAVGAVDTNTPGWPIFDGSARGPSYCTPDGQPAIKPNLTGPGINVRSSVPGGQYSYYSGVSMAVAHIAGVLALVHQACPELSVQQMKQVVYETAVDLGPPGEDNSYGWGVPNALAAVNLAIQRCRRPGDLNCDGLVNFDDINPFVLLLADPGIWQSEYPNCNPLNGDCNQDGLVNFDDIDAFVRLLSGAA